VGAPYWLLVEQIKMVRNYIELFLL